MDILPTLPFQTAAYRPIRQPICGADQCKETGRMTTEVNLEQLELLAASFPESQHLYMVNLLRFRESAEYGSDVQAAGATGQEAYFKSYLPAFGQVSHNLGIEGIRLVWAGAVVGNVAGASDERWHAAAIVEYPNLQAFRRIVESKAYMLTADPHRRAALEDWRLIATTKLDLPG